MSDLATAARIARLEADAHGYQAAAYEAEAEAFALRGSEHATAYRGFAASSWSMHESAMKRVRELEQP